MKREVLLIKTIADFWRKRGVIPGHEPSGPQTMNVKHQMLAPVGSTPYGKSVFLFLFYLPTLYNVATRRACDYIARSVITGVALNKRVATRRAFDYIARSVITGDLVCGGLKRKVDTGVVVGIGQWIAGIAAGLCLRVVATWRACDHIARSVITAATLCNRVVTRRAFDYIARSVITGDLVCGGLKHKSVGK